MANRTLVVTLGQLRAHALTWSNFRQNVLEQLGADLAVCVPHDAHFDFTNPFYTHARYRWLVPDAPDLANIFDRIQRLLGGSEDWRLICDVQGSWLGKVAQANQPGAAAILFVLRWFMLNNIRAAGLTDVYDRFIITRSDFYYLCPHPPLDCLSSDHLWVPDGEDYFGLCDRHLVVSSADLFAACSLIDDFLLRPREMRDAMTVNRMWNIEQVIAWHLTRHGLISRVRRFPYVMFLVRSPDDPSAWAVGSLSTDVGMVVKYPSELHEAKRFQQLIGSNDDWQVMFAISRIPGAFPARIYTFAGTMIYVDESTGELRHAPLSVAPANTYFIDGQSGGYIVHGASGVLHGIVCSADKSEVVNPGRTSAATRLTRMAISPASVARGGIEGLKAGDLYLGLEADGRVTLARTVCGAAELFRLIPDPRQNIRHWLPESLPGLVQGAESHPP